MFQHFNPPTAALADISRIPTKKDCIEKLAAPPAPAELQGFLMIQSTTEPETTPSEKIRGK